MANPFEDNYEINFGATGSSRPFFNLDEHIFDPEFGGELPFSTEDIISRAYSDPSYGQDTLSSMGVKDDTAPSLLDKLKGSGLAKLFTDKQGNLDWLKLLTLLGSGYAGYKSKAPPSGGGVAYAYKEPAQQLMRTVVPGKYGPVAQFAAQGGIMQAYAQGGPVAMEDGGFVMTKKAVDGAGGPQGIRSLLPGARPIRGPGTGTSDSIPAYIQGRNTVTPARVSDGEAYVPKATVQQAGGSRQLYDLMNMLQRRA